MNDYDKFRQFFDSMGTVYGMPDNVDQGDHRHGEEPVESIFNLSVSQAHFCFDKDKRYIGVVSDEMGFFEPRSE